MSIVKMKRLRLIGMKSDQDVLLRRLMALGCVELRTMPRAVSDDMDVQTSNLAEQQEKLQHLNLALGILKKYAPEKGSLFSEKNLVSKDVFFSDGVVNRGLVLADELILKDEQIVRLRTVVAHAKERAGELSPWQALDVPLDTQGSAHTAVLFGTMPILTEFEQVSAALARMAPESALYRVGADKKTQCLMAICHRAVQEDVLHTLRELGFTAVSFPERDTASACITALQQERDDSEQALSELLVQVKALSERRSELKLCLDRITQEIALEEAKQKLQSAESKFTLEGWFSAPQERELAALLGTFSCTWEQSDPMPNEYSQVPVKLKGNKLTEPLNMVTEMYSLPAYDGIDPNGLMMPFFAIFFGLMYADLGYGLILILTSLLLGRKRLGRGMKHAMGLLLQVGITTSIFGAIFGGFFGDVIPVFSETFLAQRIDPWMLFDPLSDPIMLMVGALVLGAIQIFVGMCVQVYLCFRDGHPWDAFFDVGSWWLLFAGIALLALGHGAGLMAAGAVSVVLASGRHAKSLPGKLFGGLGKLYNITNYLSDVLSYIRLMALFLATGVISSVFNMLGSMLGAGIGGVIGIIGFFVVFLIGHAFNMGMNIIGTYVHAIRLQYLEFFGKFYKDGGRPFQPLAIRTKYYDIIE